MKSFFSDDELYDILDQLDDLDEVEEFMVLEESEDELYASKRRYEEIIKKHRTY